MRGGDYVCVWGGGRGRGVVTVQHLENGRLEDGHFTAVISNISVIQAANVVCFLSQ